MATNEMAKGGGIKQTKPQETDSTYSKAIDKRVEGKPVGWRFSDKLAKKLGKKEGTKPTAAEIEKYKNRGVYFETRKNKSDLNPKAKLESGGESEYAKGGQTAPQRESYSKRGDREVKAKPVGYRFTEKLANRLGKNVFTKPTQEQIEKYRGKGVYFENRKDKSDLNPRAMFKGGGHSDEILSNGEKLDQFTAVGIAEGFVENDNLLDQIKAWAYIQRHGLTRSLQGWFGRTAEGMINRGIFDRDGNIDYEIVDEISMGKYDDDYAKGGQTAPQRESYSKRGDREVKAKPVGYRFTEKLANRLGKNVYTKPTQEQIEKYSGRGVYFENRKDKSDIKPASYLAQGGVTQHGLRNGDKITSHHKNYLVVSNGGKEFIIDISNGERREMKGNTIGKVLNNPKKEEGGELYAQGGQTSAQRESYSKRGDAQVKAKPVGYRFTKSLAKRLGKNPFTKPTAEQVRKYLGKGVYFENRKDKSDLNPKAMLEQGGDMEYAKGGQTAPQETDSTYSKSIDKRVSGKPVGYRFTNKLAKKLGKNPQTAPKASEIEKYSGKGVYFETRRNKSDLNPKAKLESGGDVEKEKRERELEREMLEYDRLYRYGARGGMMADGKMMARGGVARISNADTKAYTENHLPFMANNLEGKTLENGDYVVLSYGYYPIWFWHKRTNKWYGNKDKFSVTTAKHISQSRPTYDAEMLSRGEMDNLMSKSIEGKDFKEMGGTLDSSVVAQQ